MVNSKVLKPRILVVTYISSAFLRQSQKSLINCYKKYSKNFEVHIINLFMSNILSECNKYNWDIIIYHSSFIGLRFNRARFLNLLKKNHQELINIKASHKALTIQDEFSNMDLVCDFINKYSVDTIFSVAPRQEIKKIYKNINFNKIKFFEVLTGYIDENQITKIKNINTFKKNWIGYRVYTRPEWGTFNLKKIKLGLLFQKYCKQNNIKHDIAFGEENFFLGDKWNKFLLQCRAVIGIEGGSNILDWDGSFSKKINKIKNKKLLINYNYLKKLEKNLEKIKLMTISPRHLDACLTKTCQLLVKGKYNNILKPWKHYIPINKNMTNLSHVMKILNDDKKVNKIIHNAYKDIIQSRKYTYKKFVEFMLSKFKVNKICKEKISFYSVFLIKINYLNTYVCALLWSMLKKILSAKLIFRVIDIMKA